MTNDEIKAYIKSLMTSDNADDMGKLLSSIQDKDTQIESLKTENLKLKDKIVEQAFRTPIKDVKGEQDIKPEGDDPLSIEEAIGRWQEENLRGE